MRIHRIPGAYLAVGVPHNVAYAKSNALFMRNLILLVLVALLALIAAWLGSNFFITRPIDALVAASKRLGDGDLSARTGLRYTSDEVGQLARSFDEMADSLEKLSSLNQSILNSAGEGILVLDTDGVVTFVNPAAAAMLGWTTEELKNRQAHDLIHYAKPDGNPYPWKTCPTCISIEQGVIQRVRGDTFWRKDGTSFPVEYVSAPVTEHGKTIGAVTIFQDISERQRMEAALHKINRILKVSTCVNEMMVRATDETALLQDVCRCIVEQGGYRMAWVGYLEHDAGKSVRPMAYAGYNEGYLDTVRMSWGDTALGQGPVGKSIRTRGPITVRDTRSDPNFAPWREEALQRGYASSIAIPLFTHGQVMGVVCLYMNQPQSFDAEEVTLLTELAADLSYGISAIHIHETLGKREEQYRTIVETAQEGIHVYNADFITTFVNKQFAKMLGYTVEEMLGQPLIEIAAPEMREEFQRHLEKRKLGIKEVYEFQLQRKDGSTLWVIASVTPLIDERKQFNGGIAMITDITERHRLEEYQWDFFSKTIESATEGKLRICTREEIERLAGYAMASFEIKSIKGLEVIRKEVTKIAEKAGMEEEKIFDFILCLSEAATNALKHAGGGTVSIHHINSSLLAVVTDHGPGIPAINLPEVMLKSGFSTASSLGMGYKTMLAAADKVYLYTGPQGTIVAIEMALHPRETPAPHFEPLESW